MAKEQRVSLCLTFEWWWWSLHGSVISTWCNIFLFCQSISPFFLLSHTDMIIHRRHAENCTLQNRFYCCATNPIPRFEVASFSRALAHKKHICSHSFRSPFSTRSPIHLFFCSFYCLHLYRQLFPGDVCICCSLMSRVILVLRLATESALLDV